MKISNIIGGAALLIGFMAYSSTVPARAAPLSQSDGDALIAGYQLIQFDLAECNVVNKPASPASGAVVSVDVLRVANKLCTDALHYDPILKKVADEKGFTLPRHLPYYLTARYAALIRGPNEGLGERYLEDQISSHEDALAIFQDTAANANDPDLKAMAAQVVPLVQGNLNLLRETAKKN